MSSFDNGHQIVFDKSPVSGLSPDSVEKIHSASLKILKETGIYVEDDKSREIFYSHGAEILSDKKTVSLPSHLIENSVSSAPGKVLMAARNAAYDVKIEKGITHFGPFSGQIKIVDPLTLRIRSSQKDDVANCAKLCDALDEVSIVTRMLNALDYPPNMMQLHNAVALLHNTSKHFVIGIENAWEVAKLKEIANVVSCKSQRLINFPPFSLQTALSSPLKFSIPACEVIINSAQTGFNTVISTMAMGGATAPLSFAGTLAMTNAEVLAGIVLSQLVRKGAPIIYSNYSTTMDLKTGIAPLGSPEAAVIASAVPQLAEFYNIPCWVSGVMTDSNIADAQAAHEKTLTGIKSASSGANIIVGMGGLSSGLIFDPVQLVIDNEIVRMIKYLQSGISVNDSSLALDVIHEINHSGDYLSHTTTFRNMKLTSKAGLIERRNYEIWNNNGSHTLFQRCQNKAQDLMENYQPDKLQPKIGAKINDIMKQAEIESKFR